MAETANGKGSGRPSRLRRRLLPLLSQPRQLLGDPLLVGRRRVPVVLDGRADVAVPDERHHLVHGDAQLGAPGVQGHAGGVQVQRAATVVNPFDLGPSQNLVEVPAGVLLRQRPELRPDEDPVAVPGFSPQPPLVQAAQGLEVFDYAPWYRIPLRLRVVGQLASLRVEKYPMGVGRVQPDLRPLQREYLVQPPPASCWNSAKAAGQAFQFPRVKSGNGSGRLPQATEIFESGLGALQAAAS